MSLRASSLPLHLHHLYHGENWAGAGGSAPTLLPFSSHLIPWRVGLLMGGHEVTPRVGAEAQHVCKLQNCFRMGGGEAQLTPGLWSIRDAHL